MKTKKLYLAEDQDLLDELETTQPPASGYMSEAQKNQISSIQIKSILRGRKTAVDLDESNQKFTIAIGLLAVAQLCVAGFQLMLGINSDSNKPFAVFTALAFIVTIYWLTRLVNKIK